MIKFLKKFNFLPGIILIIIFVIPARLVENIARIILRLMNNLFAYFDYMGVSGGYLGMFYEKLMSVMFSVVVWYTYLIKICECNIKIFAKVL